MVAKMVSADSIFSRFSITWAQFLARMVSEMAPKPSKCEEHMYSKQLRPKTKNGQNYRILGLIDGGVPLSIQIFLIFEPKLERHSFS